MTRLTEPLVCLAAVVAIALASWTPPAHAGQCSRVVSVGQSVEAAINDARPGNTLCLRPGVHSEPDGEFRITAAGYGSIDSSKQRWIEVRSYRPELATLYGRLVLTRTTAWLRFTQLVLDGSGGPPIDPAFPGEKLPSPSVSGYSNSFVNVEITSRRMGTCLHERAPVHGESAYLRLRFSIVHDCGLSTPVNRAHGIYLQVPSSHAQITDNWIYDNTDRCLQLYPDADGAYVARNVLDGCGEGVIFSGSDENGSCAASDRNVLEDNVISNANVRWLVEGFWGCGLVGADNLLRRNCLWPTNPDSFYDANSGLDRTAGYESQDNLVADPHYVDRQQKDFRLAPGSPCAGKGPSAVPGPSVLGWNRSPPDTVGH